LSSDEIRFRAATVYAKKIVISPKLVAFTSAHRGQMAKLDEGILIIEQEWFPVKKDKTN